MEPLTDAGAHDDHRATTGLLGVRGELASDPDALIRRDAGDLGLPRGGVGGRGVVVPARPLAREARPFDAVLGQHQVEHRGDQVTAYAACRHTAPQHRTGAVDRGERGQENLDRLGNLTGHGEGRSDPVEVEVPPPLTGLGVPESHRAVRHHRVAGRLVEQHGLPVVLGCRLAEVGRGEELSGNETPFRGVPLQPDQERQVGVGAHVVGEERRLPVDEVLFQDDVTHRHRECGVGSCLGRHPLVGELGVVRVVRTDAHHLRAAVPHLGHPVRVRRTRDRDVGAPHHQVRRVPPVTRLRDVGLVAEHLRAGDRQVGVPVVERRHHAADQLDESCADAVRHHRHRRDR